MSVAEAVQTTTKPQNGSGSALLLQRKCACGGATGLSGECGECKTKRLLGKPLQAKLRINEPGDEYEREADRVAHQVMHMPESTVNAKALLSHETPLVQRRVSGSSAGIGAAPAIVQEVLSSPGQPLDAATRAFFEPRFAHDFSRVRVHSDRVAERSVMDLGAHAYTVGNDVVFGGGRYQPHTPSGRSLVAHELAHVVQQTAGAAGFLQRYRGKGGFRARANVESTRPLEPGATEPAEPLTEGETQNSEALAELISIDPIQVHLSDRDIERIVDGGRFSEFIVAHALVGCWVDTNEDWYVWGDVTPDSSKTDVAIVHPPRNVEQFYDALVTHDLTAERIASAGAVDFRRIAPDSLTATELHSLFSAGRFAAFVDYYGLTTNFTHGQTGELVEPETLDEFNEMRSRARDATTDEVVARFKAVLLGYLEPTLAFYNQHLLFEPPGVRLPQAVLDLFALYLQTRNQGNIAQALAVYFGVQDAEAGAVANTVVSTISRLLDDARSPLSSNQVLKSQGARRDAIASVLDALPNSGQAVSSARPFDALEEIWGAVAATLLVDEGLSLLLLLGLDTLVSRAYGRRADVAALVQRVQGIESPGEIYGLIHRFKDSPTNRAYLYDIIGIPESLVNEAGAPLPPVLQACVECHEDPFDRAHPRPPGLDVTQAEWRLALDLARARDAEFGWDTAVDILVVGGSISAAILAGAFTGGLGWGLAAAGAAGAAGLAAVFSSEIEIHRARTTEEIASGAYAASDLYPEFRLGSEGFLQWAEHNLEHTITGSTGNILVSIATAPIPGAGATVAKKILASMLMGGLDGLCGWMVDPRVNQADFLVETHVLSGGTPETAPTPGHTLVMSVSAGALFGGMFEGGMLSAQRIFFHVDIGSGHTRVTLEDGTEVTTQFEALNQQLREGDQEQKVSREFIDQVLTHSRRPVIGLDNGHEIRIDNGILVRCSALPCSAFGEFYRNAITQLSDPQRQAALVEELETVDQLYGHAIQAGTAPEVALAQLGADISGLANNIESSIRSSTGKRITQYQHFLKLADRLADNKEIRQEFLALNSAEQAQILHWEPERQTEFIKIWKRSDPQFRTAAKQIVQNKDLARSQQEFAIKELFTSSVGEIGGVLREASVPIIGVKWENPVRVEYEPVYVAQLPTSGSTIPPGALRYGQPSAGSVFNNARTLQDFARLLSDPNMDWEAVQRQVGLLDPGAPIDIVTIGKFVFTSDHKRVIAAQAAQKVRPDLEIPYQREALLDERGNVRSKFEANLHFIKSVRDEYAVVNEANVLSYLEEHPEIGWKIGVN